MNTTQYHIDCKWDIEYSSFLIELNYEYMLVESYRLREVLRENQLTLGVF